MYMYLKNYTDDFFHFCFLYVNMAYQLRKIRFNTWAIFSLSQKKKFKFKKIQILKKRVFFKNYTNDYFRFCLLFISQLQQLKQNMFQLWAIFFVNKLIQTGRELANIMNASTLVKNCSHAIRAGTLLKRTLICESMNMIFHRRILCFTMMFFKRKCAKELALELDPIVEQHFFYNYVVVFLMIFKSKLSDRLSFNIFYL